MFNGTFQFWSESYENNGYSAQRFNCVFPFPLEKSKAEE